MGHRKSRWVCRLAPGDVDAVVAEKCEAGSNKSVAWRFGGNYPASLRRLALAMDEKTK